MGTGLVLDLERWARATAGRWHGRPPSGPVSGVHIDSRVVDAGDIFVALVGDRHDAHDFLREVARAGAICAVVARGRAVPDLACLEVADTLRALQDAARGARNESSARVVAITGSNGKTTMRSMLATSIAEEGVLEPVANFNNHIGLPLTLTRLRNEHGWAVLEMGMNHRGEISFLSELARPDVAVITNVGRAHVGPVGGLNAVREAKLEIIDGLVGGGALFVPADDPALVATANERARERNVRVMSVGTEAQAVVRVRVEGPDARARFAVGLVGGPRVELSVPGRPVAAAAAMTLAVCDHVGVDRAHAARRVGAFRGVPGRTQVREIGGVIVIDDTYNANPESMVAGLEILRTLPGIGRRVAVLGDMAELGEESERAHRALITAFAGLDQVFTVGPRMALAAGEAGPPVSGGPDVTAFETREEAGAALDGWFRAGDVVLFKGSRRVGLEVLIAALFDDGGSRAV